MYKQEYGALLESLITQFLQTVNVTPGEFGTIFANAQMKNKHNVILTYLEAAHDFQSIVRNSFVYDVCLFVCFDYLSVMHV